MYALIRSRPTDLCYLTGAQRAFNSFVNVHDGFRANSNTEGKDRLRCKALVSANVVFLLLLLVLFLFCYVALAYRWSVQYCRKCQLLLFEKIEFLNLEEAVKSWSYSRAKLNKSNFKANCGFTTELHGRFYS